MYCRNCGKEIKDGATFCSECGVEQKNIVTNQSSVAKVPYNTMCIIGIVVSGISLLLNFWGLVGIAGTILSVLGLTSCQQKNENGKALAIIGIVVGSFSIIYGLISILSFV